MSTGFEIDALLIIWEEVIPGGAYWSRLIRRGTTLRIIDLEGSRGVSLLCYNADNVIERYNAADTDIQPAQKRREGFKIRMRCLSEVFAGSLVAPE